VVLVAASIALGAACSDSSTPTDASGSSTTSTRAPVTSSSSTTSTSTTSTLPPAPSSTSVSTMNGVVTIRGRGDRTVPLPPSVPLPAIVHAHHDGTDNFAVLGVDSRGQRTAVLASSLGYYDGTFPLGFVEAAGDPTTSLRIVTTGPWRIDIGPAGLAPRLGRGVQGVGDAVLSYAGSGATVHLTYRGRAKLLVNVYDHGRVIALVDTKGPFDGPISLPAGPALIAVTTRGKWSMIIV